MALASPRGRSYSSADGWRMEVRRCGPCGREFRFWWNIDSRWPGCAACCARCEESGACPSCGEGDDAE